MSFDISTGGSSIAASLLRLRGQWQAWTLDFVLVSRPNSTELRVSTRSQTSMQQTDTLKSHSRAARLQSTAILTD